MRKLSSTFRMPIFGLMMALMISCALSAIFTFYAEGLAMANVYVWLTNWLTAFCIAVPVALDVRPIAQWVAKRVNED